MRRREFDNRDILLGFCAGLTWFDDFNDLLSIPSFLY
jgi:hypothetical protein